jgi:hypothetical protein
MPAAGVGGVGVGGPGSTYNTLMGIPNTPSTPTSLFGNPASFTAAANTQASDYDRIMQQYQDLAKSYTTNPLSAQQVMPQITGNAEGVAPTTLTPTTTPYSQSADVTGSLAGLSDLATTGGYTPQGIQDIRARDTSPIRSIYANAQQNVERAKALGGGYSPNFNATQARAARDEASQISDTLVNANAGIAQNVAANRLSAAPAYASASATANAAKTAADTNNTNIINQINAMNEQNKQNADTFNSTMAAQIAEANANRVTQASSQNVANNLTAQQVNRTGALGAVQGQTNLYGTTPALTKTFGDQVTQAGQLNQGQQQVNNQKLDAFGNIATRIG